MIIFEKMSMMTMMIMALLLAVQTHTGCKSVSDNSFHRKTSVKVGALLDFNSTSGRLSRSALKMAIQDVNRDSTVLPGIHLHLTALDTASDPFLGAEAAIELLKREVVAIAGPQSSKTSPFIAHLARAYQIPLVSFGATDPALTQQKNYSFIRIAHNDAVQMEAIAAILMYYGWEEVVVLYSDDDYGTNGITALSYALDEIGARVFLQRTSLDPEIDEYDIESLLSGLSMLSSRAFVVHMGQDMALKVFSAAYHLKMMDSSYAWVITDSLGATLDSMYRNVQVVKSTEGVIGTRSYVPDSGKLRLFVSEWEAARGGQGGVWNDLDSYTFCAYDSIWVIALAIDRHLRGGGNLTFENPPPELAQGRLEFGGLKALADGVALRQSILKTNWDGTTGSIRFDANGDRVHSAFEIVNMVGRSLRVVGYWCNATGLSVSPPETTDALASSSSSLFSFPYPSYSSSFSFPSSSSSPPTSYLTSSPSSSSSSSFCFSSSSPPPSPSSTSSPSSSCSSSSSQFSSPSSSTPPSSSSFYFSSSFSSPPSSASSISSSSSSSSSSLSSSESTKLRSVIWPGGGTQVPRGWTLPRNGKPLQIGVPRKAGYNELISATINSNNDTIFQGFCINVFQEAIKYFPYAFNYEFVLFGSGNETPVYDELIDKLADKVFDVVVADIVITTERLEKVDFSQPYVESGLVTLVPDTSHNLYNAWAFLRPFTPYMWLTMALFLVFTGAVVWAVEHKDNPDFRGTPRNQIVTSFWFIFSTLFFSHQETTESLPGKVVIFIWLFVVLIIQSSYTASLTSILTVRRLSPSIQSLDTLIASDSPIGYQTGSYVKDYLIGLGVEAQRLKPLPSKSMFAKALQQGPHNGGVAAIVDEVPYIILFLTTECNYTIVGKEFTKGGWGFAFPKNSPLTFEMSEAILKMTRDGVLQKLNDFYFTQSQCNSAENQVQSENLNLGHFWGLFLVTGIISLGCLLLHVFQLIRGFKSQSISPSNSLFQRIRTLVKDFCSHADKPHWRLSGTRV